MSGITEPPATSSGRPGPRSGEALWLWGALYTWKARGRDTGNAYSLCEVWGRSGFAAPLHRHESEAEGFYVVDGLVTLVLGNEQVSVSRGDFGFAPTRSQHAFRFDSEARLLLLITPGDRGHEGLFAELGEPAQSPTLPPPLDTPPDPERTAATAARHGTVILGPPPGQ